MKLTADELRILLAALGLHGSNDPSVTQLQAKLSMMLEAAVMLQARTERPAYQGIPVRTELGPEILAAYKSGNERIRQGHGRRGLLLPEPQTPEEARRIFPQLSDAVGAAGSTEDPDFVPVWEELSRRYQALKKNWALPKCKHGKAPAQWCPDCGTGFSP